MLPYVKTPKQSLQNKFKNWNIDEKKYQKMEVNKFLYFALVNFNGGLPISRVAPLDQLLPLSLGSSGWFSQYMSYEDSKDFRSNNCSKRMRYLHFNTIFPKSTVMQYANLWFSRKIIVSIVIL